MIQGVLVAFGGDDNQEFVENLYEQIESRTGYGAEKVQMNNKTFEDIKNNYANEVDNDVLN